MPKLIKTTGMMRLVEIGKVAGKRLSWECKLICSHKDKNPTEVEFHEFRTTAEELESVLATKLAEVKEQHGDSVRYRFEARSL